MRATTTLLTFTVAACLGTAMPLLAQTPAPAKPAAKPATKPAPPAPPAKRTPPPPPPLPAAGPEQITAAEFTHYGNYDCEFKQTVDVSINPQNAGYVDVKLAKQTWTMKPVLSSTGALRLEDVKGRMLMLQIANKSMLMDVQAGRRVVDDCLHEKQRDGMARAAAAAKAASGPAGAASASIFVPQ